VALEYSWVKATAVSVRLRILFVTLQNTNMHWELQQSEIEVFNEARVFLVLDRMCWRLEPSELLCCTS